MSELSRSATVGEEEIKRFRVGDILFNDEQAKMFCDLAIRGLRSMFAPSAVADAMVDRFLSWRLPQDFSPDCGITFKPHPHPNAWPIGTNLLNADQARKMLEHVLAIAPSATLFRCPSCEREWSEQTQAEPGKYETPTDAWLPMDSAPKDKRILLKWGERIECGGWELQQYHRNPKPYWSGDGEPSFGVKRYRDVPPDGWMLLPEVQK